MRHSKLLLASALAGVAIGMLFAPKKGKDLQRALLDSIDELKDEALEISERVKGAAEKVKTKVANAGKTVGEKAENVKNGYEDLKVTAGHFKTIFS